MCFCVKPLVKASWFGAVESLSRGELSSSPLLNQQLTKFSHEVIDLLQHSPRCCLPFSRFIPTYHHHFGRQCRIATYGFTKLIELFDAIPHVAEVCMCEFLSDVDTVTHSVVVVIAQQLSSLIVSCPGWGKLCPWPGCPMALALRVVLDGFDSWTLSLLQTCIWIAE